MKLSREFGKKLIYVQIIYSILIKFLISELGFPYFLNYVTDLLTFLLFFCIVKSLKRYSGNPHMKFIMVYFLLYFLYCALSSLFNFVSPFLFIWAFRNMFRFFIFFLACIICLDIQDEDKIWNCLLKLQVLNIFFTLYQFMIKGYNNDFLGGIFGYGQGVNGGTNLFFCVLLIIAINRFINKKSSLKELIFVIVSTLSLSVLSEIKLYYIEFIVILLATLLITKPSIKMGLVTICVFIIAYFGIGYLKTNFPDFYFMITNPNELYKYSINAYGNNHIIGRMTAISQINRTFFNNNVILELFGLGFGNCESSSSISVFNSAFSNMYSGYNYKFFSYAMTYLETGYVGLVLYLLFFVLCAYHVVRNRKIVQNKENVAIVICTVIISIIATWYNYSMKIEYAYFMFAVLSFGIIEARSSLLNNRVIK